jgi:hypothetical protein
MSETKMKWDRKAMIAKYRVYHSLVRATLGRSGQATFTQLRIQVVPSVAELHDNMHACSEHTLSYSMAACEFITR